MPPIHTLKDKKLEHLIEQYSGPKFLPCGVVHSVMNERVDGVYDEGDDAQPEGGGGPLPGGEGDVGGSAGEGEQGGGAQPVDHETWKGYSA